jgi:hypothetical protein
LIRRDMSAHSPNAEVGARNSQVGFVPILLQKSFGRGVRNSKDHRCGFGAKIAGTSSPQAKLISDFANTTEFMRIVIPLAFQVFAKIQTAATFDFCNGICQKQKFTANNPAC